MSTPSTIARVVVALAACALVGTTAACGKRCDTAAGCVKQCTCNDVANSVRINCQITFNCDAEGKVCDPGFDKSCEEFCQTYAAIGACGNRQCSDDSHCMKRCPCQTQSGLFYCDFGFACQKEQGVCDSTYVSTPCDTICEAQCNLVLIRDQ